MPTAALAAQAPQPPVAAPREGGCGRVVKADIVAIEQAYILNRQSAFVPAGMMFALKRDVVPESGSGDLLPGHVRLRPDKRPRPLTLRVNEGDCLEVRLTNLLSPTAEEEGGLPPDDGGRLPGHVTALAGSTGGSDLVRAQKTSVDQPRTRAASFHVTGLELAPIAETDCPVGAACGGDGSNVGLPGRQGLRFNPATPPDAQARFDIGSLGHPGQTVVTRWRAAREGAYFAHSAAAPVGGEGDGGQIGLGLFAAVNVEPKGSRWYRSQVTFAEIEAARTAPDAGRHPYSAIDYERQRVVNGRSVPILDLVDGAGNIVHSDLNAIIVPERAGKGGLESEACTGAAFGSTCDLPFREFTVIFHDEIHAEQAFAELDDENGPLNAIKDGMGINYGSSGMGSLVMTTPTIGKNTGVARNCPECRAEEFFLSSWANGDPALVLSYQGDKPAGARYPDDPSNVHHSYLGDPVRFRNLHAGPKETHVFHLHAHQWMQDQSDPNSTYLDSQTISPGATFSYSIGFGGAGNRNYTPGDSIFHCHLYPHFAQGMWELWRVHDAFVDGRPGLFDAGKPVGPENDPAMMNLPDPEIAGGTASPAIVPIPAAALAPMPTADFRGYPFYIPGKPGHRPPQPALDLDVDGAWSDLSTEPVADRIVDGGLPRHVVSGGTLRSDFAEALKTGGDAAQVIAQRVASQDPAAVETLARQWNTLSIEKLDLSGTPAEKTAMRFHEGTLAAPGFDPVADPPAPRPIWWKPKAYRTDVAAPLAGQPAHAGPPLFFVNGNPRAPGAPYANPCPELAPRRDYRAAFIQTELTYNKHGWFDPQGRIVILENDIKDVIDPDKRTKLPEPLFFRANSGECITFRSSNFVPAALNADDFQIYTPTDTIGQHIHLVKFDVTSSDGSGNGFNYEDATFSPQEVRDRIFAFNRTPNADGSPKTQAQKLWPKEHPLFREGGDIRRAAEADPERYGALLEKGRCPPKTGAQTDEAYAADLQEKHPLCGAQRTNQRWWADPILNTVSGKDNTLRTVFTHDHLGPSSHQQHGLYAGLVIEPANSVWTRVDKAVTPSDLATAAMLRCGPDAPSDPAGLCGKLLGGSNLALVTDPAILAGDALEKPVAPRPPFRLREDGGPTATVANIIAPKCIGDSNSNPLQPLGGRNSGVPKAACPPARETHDTRREFTLAIADFGIAYNTALEPINPEPRGDASILRDATFLRFGRRHVAAAPARPLAISSEDPGSQYFNYRDEPLALRLSEATPDPVLGGWNYRQNPWRADLATPCRTGDQDCLGDPANGFATAVHAKRDERLAKDALPAIVTPQTRQLFAGTPVAGKLDDVALAVERWRRRFNCMLYPVALMGAADGCAADIVRLEPWRVFGDPATPILPAFEGDPVQIRLVQGAQEAQHIFTMNGNKWHRFAGSNGARDDNASGFTNAQPVGISEHFEFDVLVNPFEASHGDYLYFGSSMDQLWDGLWGTMRAFSHPKPGKPATDPVATSASPGVSFRPGDFLATLPDVAVPPRRGGNKPDICASPAAGEPEPPHRFFDVSAVRVCDLDNSCGTARPTGIPYSTRFGIRDERGLAYVLEAEGPCRNGAPAPGAPPVSCDVHESDWRRVSNRGSLERLRTEFALGRKLEPLVLRAAAGECLHVNLRNELPAAMDDGPRTAPDGEPQEVPEARAYLNFLPMIADGFNINQFRMSSTVGLSAARIVQHPIWGDGSNVGLNSPVLTRSADLARPPFGAPPDATRRQGTLVPPCLGRAAVDGAEETRCRASLVWSATDFQFDEGYRSRPVEFGAVPLRDFGDPLKHAAHGLIGALVVGPAGSEVCANDRFAAQLLTENGLRRVPGGVSAEICRRDGSRYLDHVLLMQDAVNATRGGLPVPNLSGAEEPDDYGVKAINYRTEPLWARTGNDPSIGFTERNEADESAMLSSALVWENGVMRCRSGVPPVPALANPCDPETPILSARPGEEVRLSFVHSGGHTRQQGLAVSGHAWNPYPWSKDSRVLDPAGGSSIRQGVFNGFGPMMGISLVLKAGGTAGMPLDYLIRSQASFLFDGGLWALLRVGAENETQSALAR